MNIAELDKIYMQTALLHAKLSKAKRKKVGACLVTTTGVIIPSWNGTPQGSDNDCEDVQEDGSLVTKPEVIHAELGCITKCTKEGIRTTGASIYVSLSPCITCSAILAHLEIKKVFYCEEYRDTSGIILLRQRGVDVQQICLI